MEPFFFRPISTADAVWTGVALGLPTALMNVLFLSRIRAAVGAPPETRIGLPPPRFQAFAKVVQASPAVGLYRGFLLVDLVFAVAYGLVLPRVLDQAVKELFGSANAWNLLWIPLAAGAADFLENVVTFALTFTRSEKAMATLSSICARLFTTGKWLGLMLTATLGLGGLLWWAGP